MNINPLVATAPAPTLTIDGPTATITDVRFLHVTWCPYCRTSIEVATDGGAVITGITEGKAPRWFDKSRPAAAPTTPATCPTCDKALLPRRDWSHVRPVHLVVPLLNKAYAAIRANRPDLAGPADRADGIVA